MKKLFLMLLALVLLFSSTVHSFAVWDDFSSDYKEGYDLNSTVNSGNPFTTQTNPYRGGELRCSYKVQNWILWKAYIATSNCYSNSTSSKSVLTFFSAEYSYSKIDTKDSTSTSFTHSANQTSVPFGVQYYFEYDNDGPGHDTHYLFYRIYDI